LVAAFAEYPVFSEQENVCIDVPKRAAQVMEGSEITMRPRHMKGMTVIGVVARGIPPQRHIRT
jgi:hypothetical protein